MKNGHEYVDLGLPSGTLWATCNIGADKPEDFGDYFQWGDILSYKCDFVALKKLEEENLRAKMSHQLKHSPLSSESKSSFSILLDGVDYKYFLKDSSKIVLTERSKIDTSDIMVIKYSTGKYKSACFWGTADNKTELELTDDAAYVKWGSNWRIPTVTQLEELMNPRYTRQEYIVRNGVCGCLISSKKNMDQSVFLPAARSANVAGFETTEGKVGIANVGYYWSRNLEVDCSFAACVLYVDSEPLNPSRRYKLSILSKDRRGAYSIRPVWQEKK
jgi:hypothetical protein